MLQTKKTDQKTEEEMSLSYSSNSANPIVQAKKLSVEEKVKDFVLQKDYPCIGALRAVKKGDYRIGVYKNFGSGDFSRHLHGDLLTFLVEQKRSQSPYLSFWAAFPEDFIYSEEDFETRLWRELSFVGQLDKSEWDLNFSSDPTDKKFCFSLGGSAFFVVGMFAKSSRVSRQFPYPSIVFNLYEQFEILDRLGQYESMVEINRKKAVNFEGGVNPMVAQHGDKWEAIQFSGKQNTSDWKCPFHHLAK